MSEESESYRLKMLRRLERERDGPLPPKVLEAEKVIADFRKKQAQARDAIIRLSSPLPKNDLCPKCYFLHGRSVIMEPRMHSDPDRFDLMECPKCGHNEERELRR